MSEVLLARIAVNVLSDITKEEPGHTVMSNTGDNGAQSVATGQNNHLNTADRLSEDVPR